MTKFREERARVKHDPTALSATDGEVLAWELCGIARVYKFFIECNEEVPPGFLGKGGVGQLLAGDWPEELL